MYSIAKGYKNHNGMYYSNIRNIQFSKQSDLMHIGDKKAITTYSDSNNKFIDTAFKQNNGVIIYQTLYDKNKALRIYNDYTEYKYTFHNDENLVSELQKRQANVKLTGRPAGRCACGTTRITPLTILSSVTPTSSLMRRRWPLPTIPHPHTIPCFCTAHPVWEKPI